MEVGKKSYGPLGRRIESGRHIYYSRINATRIALAVASLFGVALCAWMLTILRHVLRDLSVARDLGAAFLALLGLGMLLMLVIVLYAQTRVAISPDGVELHRRGWITGRGGRRTWPLEELVQVMDFATPTFHVGGTTPTHGVVLVFATGDMERLGAAFDDAPSTNRVIADIIASVEAMAAAMTPPES